MCIDACALYIELHIEQALGSQHQFRATFRVEIGSFPQAPIGLQQGSICRSNGLEVRAADLLFTFNDPAQRNRQLTVGSAQGADRCQASSNLALVVACAASVKLPVAHGWFKGRREPQLEWLGGLDIVVVIEQDCIRAAAGQFPIDRGRRSFNQETLRLKANTMQQLLDQVGHLCHAQILRGHAWLSTELFEQRPGFARVVFEISCQSVCTGHQESFPSLIIVLACASDRYSPIHCSYNLHYASYHPGPCGYTSRLIPSRLGSASAAQDTMIMPFENFCKRRSTCNSPSMS